MRLSICRHATVVWLDSIDRSVADGSQAWIRYLDKIRTHNIVCGVFFHNVFLVLLAVVRKQLPYRSSCCCTHGRVMLLGATLIVLMLRPLIRAPASVSPGGAPEAAEAKTCYVRECTQKVVALVAAAAVCCCSTTGCSHKILCTLHIVL